MPRAVFEPVLHHSGAQLSEGCGVRHWEQNLVLRFAVATSTLQLSCYLGLPTGRQFQSAAAAAPLVGRWLAKPSSVLFSITKTLACSEEEMQPFWSFGAIKWNCSGPSRGKRVLIEKMLQRWKRAAYFSRWKCLVTGFCSLRERMSLKTISKESPPRKSKTSDVNVSKTISMGLLPFSPMPCLWIWINYTKWLDKGALMGHLPPEKCINGSLTHTLQCPC